MDVRSAIDWAVEAPVVTSFTRVGATVRSRVDGWTPLDDYELDGRVVLLTGPTSGIGRAAARQLARCGARLLLLGRDEQRTAEVCGAIAEETGNDDVVPLIADMGDFDAVRRVAEQVREQTDRLDAVVHNAGALTPDRRVTPGGVEATVASQVAGPFLLTGLLLDLLRAGAPSRVITVSSGGMYTSGLTVSRLEMSEDEYRGAEQYARAKRAQVTLTELWAERFGAEGIRFHAMHPGWADTPGVEASLPTFHRLVGPLLRSPADGADTIVWLVADDGEPLDRNGRFWHDRRPRSTHRLRSTRRSDVADRREELWRWCVETSGLEPEASS